MHRHMVVKRAIEQVLMVGLEPDMSDGLITNDVRNTQPGPFPRIAVFCGSSKIEPENVQFSAPRLLRWKVEALVEILDTGAADTIEDLIHSRVEAVEKVLALDPTLGSNVSSCSQVGLDVEYGTDSAKIRGTASLWYDVEYTEQPAVDASLLDQFLTGTSEMGAEGPTDQVSLPQ